MTPAVPQAIHARLSEAAIFLVVTLEPGPQTQSAVRELCGDLAALARGLGFRAPEAELSCVVGIGSDLWDAFFGDPRPAGLHPFREIHGVHLAPSTPADLLFHIRAARMDLCFELATRILARLGGGVAEADTTSGFRYFDSRDLLGFVDGTENPVGHEAVEATVIGDEDAAFAGGSYVIVQKYLHDLDKWEALPVEVQEGVIGRKKFSDIELDDDVRPSYAHNVLTSIEEDGEELEILRHNMPFGDPARGEFGTYFIGYARSPERMERMLDNMFIGDPPGNYDRLLDVSRAVTGSLFFVPSAAWLEAAAASADTAPLAPDSTPAPVPDTPDSSPQPSARDGSLGIGSLKTRDPS